ncbi:hypothetical protein D5085_01100 [Ectothiorhodospiraceae bacterium BW-2]|nr:hypothetical protein D5085_01100 [Ectothiorhodospiraceae bacterium BW-2]
MMSQVVIFANSIKKQQRCIAGKRVDTKGWIRPVASNDGAEISANRCLVKADQRWLETAPLQLVEMELGNPVPLVNQPENYLMTNKPWRYIRHLNSHELGDYLDTPESLWGSGAWIDYSDIEQGSLVIDKSLLLVKVEQLHLFYRETSYGRVKRRARFVYNHHNYDLPVTDPAFAQQVEQATHHTILCISLGEKFDYYGDGNYSCFKIVASIL